MKEIDNLLAEKENALQQVKRQIAALRRTAALLAEPEVDAPAAVPAIVAAVQNRAGARPDEHGEAPAVVEPLAMPAPAATSTVPDYVRFASPAQIFPPATEGIIVCDLCGHRNPDFLLDCERCDLPIRLRP